MALVKLLQASDVHDETVGAKRFKGIVNLANQVKVDGMLLIGDFFDKQDVALSQFLRQRNLPKIRERLEKYTPKEKENFGIAYGLYQQLGGLEGAKRRVNSPDLPDEERKNILELIKLYEANQVEIDKLWKEHAEWSRDLEQKVTKKVLAESKKRYEGLDKILTKYAGPVLGIRGNWETDSAYEANVMKKLKLVEKEKSPVKIKGLSFVGAPNWYEAVVGKGGLPIGVYEKMEHDFVDPEEDDDPKSTAEQVATFIKKHAPDEFDRYVANVNAGGNPKDIPVAALEKHPVYARLKNKADVLLTHKGPDKMALRQDGFNTRSGWCLEHAVENNVQPSIILGGHIHGKGLYDDSNGYQGLRSSDRRVYVTTIDDVSKKITQIDVYKWADREKQAAKEAEKAKKAA